ncbi:SAICAR synthase-like protein [Basidiobolus meristosporus CBS 931.73]|uniref:Kinase n=1 Tax=Basidiobolus meristosporus CBS 931.73 TaxID=1314790 RepID=A0A1Y1ZDL8_9FUNG|nr:SAICAR synthase-like protein [Basidiobolus meristosporus CBS 931.73]|eukprot:ORY08309.1 SAICAR synthase-like protein [Basidiobolus meristosporus CBS 931.73]
MSAQVTTNLPTAEARAFEHQVAGHGGVYSLANGMIAKPCCEMEYAFYEQSASFPEFQNFLPRFYGTLRLATPSEKAMLENTDDAETIIQNPTDVPNPEQVCICIEDVSHGFRKPSILDIKLGTRLYDDDATPEKRARMIAKAEGTTSASLGVRVCGLKVFDRDTKAYTVYPREFGRKLKDDTLFDAICKFFPPTLDRKYRLSIIEGFLEEMNEYLSVVEKSELRMYSASVLFIYEGDPLGESPVEKEKEEEDESDDEGGHSLDFRVIDFAHSRWSVGAGPDEQYLFGLRNTMKLFSDLRDTVATE